MESAMQRDEITNQVTVDNVVPRTYRNSGLVNCTRIFVDVAALSRPDIVCDTAQKKRPNYFHHLVRDTANSESSHLFCLSTFTARVGCSNDRNCAVLAHVIIF